ncbi:MAG: AMP-binding protein, partial [Deltaproteobacteria bacterium]|nr:AMP-binding protein [Deltaproteobacteria bacterium]
MAKQKLKRPSLDYPLVPVYELLRRAAERLPEKRAIIDPYGERSLTFAEINRESDTLAQCLLQWGVQKGERVSFFAPNSWEYFVGFYAALKAGAVVSPINPTFREREVYYQLNDAESRVLFAHHELLPIVDGVFPQLPFLEKTIILGGPANDRVGTIALPDLLTEKSTTAPLPVPLLDPQKDLAALPYSSGTAGLNKGVMISHFNLVANSRQSMHACETREDDVFISFLPFNHIYGLTYFLCGAIDLGAQQILMPRFSVEDCLQLIERYRVSVIFCVQPTLLAFLNFPRLKFYDLSSLRFIWVGAAPLAPAIAREIREKLGVPVARHYGLSEASPTTHVNPPGRIKENSVGIAVSDCEDRILDSDTGKIELPFGQPGELAVRGPNVFQGYWKHPEDNPLALRDGWLYTGDIAWMDEEGYLYIFDRKKEIIKHLEYQIAPAELEAILMEHPAVKDCAVVGIPEESVGEFPKAFIVPRQGQKADVEEILAFVAERI